jgi:hypothetical protein
VSASPLSIPNLREVLEEVADLRSQVEGLLERQALTERALAQGMAGADADAPIYGLQRIARAIGLKSRQSLRHWITDVDLAERHRLAMLLKRTPSGRWMTTPRLVGQWRRATETNPWEVR